MIRDFDSHSFRQFSRAMARICCKFAKAPKPGPTTGPSKVGWLARALAPVEPVAAPTAEDRMEWALRQTGCALAVVAFGIAGLIVLAFTVLR